IVRTNSDKFIDINDQNALRSAVITTSMTTDTSAVVDSDMTAASAADEIGYMDGDAEATTGAPGSLQNSRSAGHLDLPAGDGSSAHLAGHHLCKNFNKSNSCCADWRYVTSPAGGQGGGQGASAVANREYWDKKIE